MMACHRGQVSVRRCGNSCYKKGFFTLVIIEDSLVPACSDPLQLSVFVLFPFCGNVSTALGDLIRHKSIRWSNLIE